MGPIYHLLDELTAGLDVTSARTVRKIHIGQLMKVVQSSTVGPPPC